MPKIEEDLRQRFILAFPGKDWPSPAISSFISEYRPAGVTLYRSLNVDHPSQVRELTSGLQEVARQAGMPPLLIATDQEGGQLMAIGEGTTQLPGNLALGATGSTELARQAGLVLGRELAAMGINVDYAPCCDVNINPDNPVVGTRSFGEDPMMVAGMAAAMVSGIQSSGIAAAVKHFPGHGDTSQDSHIGIPVITHTLERLRSVELPPFEAAIQAGTRLVMTAHLALPAFDGRDDLPATLSSSILQGLLRQELGFTGTIITDALDMGAILQTRSIEQVAVDSVIAGADLLLLGPSQISPTSIFKHLSESLQRGKLNGDSLRAASRRIKALKEWLGEQGPPPDLDVVGCPQHQAIAGQIAQGSVTLVRDQLGLIPLRPPASQRIAVFLPKPIDLTPADTSSYVLPTLAQELRRYFPAVDDFILPNALPDEDIAAVVEKAKEYRLIVIGTINAYSQPAQARFVRSILQTGIPCIVAAMRMPYDLTVFPEAPVFVCTYGILEPSMHALAQALAGIIPFKGRLPVTIPDLYAVGHGMIG